MVKIVNMVNIENKYTPALRFPDFLNEGEWEVKRLGEIVKEVEEKCSIGKLDIDTYISTENMLQNLEGVKKASKLPETGSFTRFQKGDILFSNIRPYLKKVWQAEFEGAASNDVIVFRAQTEYDSGFVSQIIKSDSFIAHTMAGAKGVKMPRGDKNMMLEFPVCVPCLSEQRRIAQALTALDELIAGTNEKLEQMKAYKKGLMQKLFPAKGKKLPELRFKEFEKDGEWTVKGLGEFVDVFQGYGFPERMQGKTRGKYPFIKVSDISMTVNNGGKYIDVANNYVDEEDLPILGATPFPFGTIVFAKIGEAIRLNRRVILSKPSLIDNNVGGVKAKDGLSNDDFVFYIMSMIDLVKYAGGVVPAVKKTTIENIEVLMPPTLDEQQKIAEVLTSIDRTIMQKTKKTNLLKKYKKGLMQQMFVN